jgi:hypothetical protein
VKRYIAHLGLIFILVTATARSYTRITSSSGASPKWADKPIPFWINENGYPPIGNGSDIEAVLESFHTWEAVPTADLRFDYRGKTAAHIAGYDGINMISFTDTTTALPSSVIAVTLSYFKSQGSQLVFDESDIIFNTVFPYSTSGEGDKFDIQSILTHEIGHFVGLDHAAMVSSVMVPFGKLGQLDTRTLQYDDIAAISEVYPKGSGSPAVGEIHGSVMSATQPVFGANVVAVDQDGTAWVSTLSQRSGSFALKFLPPGRYNVYAEPLNQPVTEQNLSPSWYRNLNTNFGTTYYGGVSNVTQAQPVSVAAGTVTDGITIQVLPRGTQSLNLTRPAFGVRLPRNAFGTLIVGGDDITAGTQFNIFAPDVLLGAPFYGGSISSAASTSASMSVSVSPNATLGAKNLTVMRGVDTAVASGALVIVDTQPNPTAVIPAVGPTMGGTTVTILGSAFRPGAQVSFAGVKAADVNVVDDGTIVTSTPQSIPGGANVLVINADGTNGLISGGFTYIPPAPTISAISPSVGPPTTVVTITGTGFDSHAQNVQVQFNGTIAQVTNTSPSSITAIVPYGATSGALRVSVFGIAASSALPFSVTSPLLSTNSAANTYNFIDASAANGGSVITTRGPDPRDDGLATVQLPFTFSLFNDTYVAGAPITVSTNGWISLLPFDDPYSYENGSLPGVSAVDVTGVPRTIPPALIAAFHDDLALIPNVSSISIKTIGSAPNRQFIVQFTRLTILDETGQDQNASITFEIILFEGTNDIQFIYQNMSGSHADGSSATIGLQNLARNTAVLTSFNQPAVQDGLFLTYGFTNGSYRTSSGTLDTTPTSTSIIPYAPQDSSEFTGLALFASVPMSVVLKAYDANGNLVEGGGVQNPVTLALSAGQQYARLIQELFGLYSFDGWIRIAASKAGLGVYSATGSWNMSEMDGAIARDPSTDFILLHPGATAVLVNPSPRTATVTITDFDTNSETVTIPPLSKASVPVSAISRVQSSEALAAVERFGLSPKLGIGTPQATMSAQPSFVIPNTVVGNDYTSTLSLANVANAPADMTVSFGGYSRSLHMDANSATRVSVADFLQIPGTAQRSDAIRIDSSQPIVAAVDVANAVAVASMVSRPAATDVWYPNVAQGSGLSTVLSIATGATDANVMVEVYPSTGGTPQSTIITVKANQQISKGINELVGSITPRQGGYIHLHSDQPIWSWEMYVSGTILASGPPIENFKN